MLRNSDRPDLARVSERISAAVLEFCGRTSRFHMTELVAFVRDRVGTVAPDSASRILRQLRRAGKVRYRVVDRSASLYQIVTPTPTQTSFAELLTVQHWRDDG